MPLQYLDLSELFLAELALERFNRVLSILSLLPHLYKAELAILKGKRLTFFSLLYNSSLGLCRGVVMSDLDDTLHHPGYGGVEDQRCLGGLAAQAERLTRLLTIYLRPILT